MRMSRGGLAVKCVTVTFLWRRLSRAHRDQETTGPKPTYTNPPFFDVNPLPHPIVPDELLTNLTADNMKIDENYKPLRYMDMAMFPVPGEESAVVDFATFRLPTVNRRSHVKTDVCIVDSNDDILLLIQEDKQYMEPKDSVPQLIAEAIAAFQANNHRRAVLGQRPIDHKVIPGIILKGTAPVFYKIPVTTQLAESVALGVYPSALTVVHTHLPAMGRWARRQNEGMKPLNNRATMLSCYEAFKRFVN
ncbi:hypothetical protein AMATHDRAFT_75875 [Amanita thiersii Skay4041]|uniref:Uncharacterized protein n=1 Tax=Amanita thiersii Skay4041 TaxID=703135 RepID=A0A2A9NG77_9AGAR|nr:hypothetical protein AMATHDRAFT_75875 [Amanita thiersii Skay4041]